MKKPLLRELLWVSLPSLIIAGAVAWKRGGQDIWRSATTPRVESTDVYFYRVGPLAGQNAWDDDDFGFVVPITVHDPLRMTGTTGVGIDWQKQQFFSQDGKPLSPQPTISGKLPTPYLFNKKIDPSSTGDRLRGLSCDLDRVPLSKGEITLRSRWLLPNGVTQPFSVVVRPSWFCRHPRTLRLKTTRWLSGEEPGVEIVLHAGGETANLLLDDGSTIGWKQGDPKGEEASLSVLRPRLLYNWSPRFQSNDGRYDSHKARDAHVWAVAKAHYLPSSQPLNVRPLLDEFKPQVTVEPPKREGHAIKIIYRFDGLRTEPRAQQFVTDIGVPGDGFLRVKVPVPSLKSKTKPIDSS